MLIAVHLKILLFNFIIKLNQRPSYEKYFKSPYRRMGCAQTWLRLYRDCYSLYSNLLFNRTFILVKKSPHK